VIEHGTISRYTYYRCRCPACKRASKDQKRMERGTLTPDEVQQRTALRVKEANQ